MAVGPGSGYKLSQREPQKMVGACDLREVWAYAGRAQPEL